MGTSVLSFEVISNKNEMDIAIFDDVDEIASTTAGTRVKRIIDRAKQGSSDHNISRIYFQGDTLKDNGEDENNTWRIYDIKDEDIHKYLLEEEIKSSLRDDDGNTLSDNTCHYDNVCCLSSTFNFFRTSQYLKRNAQRTHQLWTWYATADNRPLFTFADALDLIIDIFERKKISKKIRSEAHVVFIGDSLMQQTYPAFICSLQRTLGARVVKRAFRTIEEQKKILIRGSNGNYQPIREEQALIEVNSTFKGKGIRRVKFSFIRQYRPFYENINNTYTAAVLKTLCGIPFQAWNANGDQKIMINPKKDNVDVIFLNHGVHHHSIDELKEVFNENLKTMKECKKFGVHTIFRDSYAQHFRFNFGGEFDQLTLGKKEGKDIVKRSIDMVNATYCAPNVYITKDDINWRYQSLKEHFDVIDLDNNTICKSKYDENFIDFVPAYATTNYYWNSHRDFECTHFLYSPGFYLPIQDGFYKSIYRSTLNKGECKPLPNNSKSPYIPGPMGLEIGKRHNHGYEFLPTLNSLTPTQPSLGKHETLLDPIIN